MGRRTLQTLPAASLLLVLVLAGASPVAGDQEAGAARRRLLGDSFDGRNLQDVRDAHYKQYNKDGAVRAPGSGGGSKDGAKAPLINPDTRRGQLHKPNPHLLEDSILEGTHHKADAAQQQQQQQQGAAGGGHKGGKGQGHALEDAILVGQAQAAAKAAKGREDALSEALLHPQTHAPQQQQEVGGSEGGKQQVELQLTPEERALQEDQQKWAREEEARATHEAFLEAQHARLAALGRSGGSGDSARQLAAAQPTRRRSRDGDAFAQQKEEEVLAFRLHLLETRKQAAAAGGGDGGTGGAGGSVQPGGGHLQYVQPPHAATLRRDLAQQAAGPRPRVPLATVVMMTVAMAGAAGIGALPFFFVRALSTRLAALATALACGVMLATSFDLIHEGQPYGPVHVVLGLILGGAFIQWSQKQLQERDDIQFDSLKGASARKVVLVIGIMAAHALGEGAGVGVSFSGDHGWSQGLLTTLAIGLHNVPEGLAKATVLVSQGVSARQALLWSVLTCLPQPLVAIPAFLFVETFTALLPAALGFAGGCMVWMVFAELLPDALEQAPHSQIATAATVSAAALEGCRMLFESLEASRSGVGVVGGRLKGHHAAAAHIVQMVPTLLLVAPAVCAAAAAGGLLGSTRMPAPTAFGLAAALAASAGLGSLLDLLLYRPGVPLVHTLSAAVAGAAALLLVRRQLLAAWGGKGKAGGSKSDADVEALGSQAQLSQGAAAAAAAGGMDGSDANDTNLLADAYHRTARPTASEEGKGGSMPPLYGASAQLDRSSNGKRGAASAAGSAAAAAGLLALLAAAVPQGWRFAHAIVLLATDASDLLLPMALPLALKGVAAAALTRGWGARSMGASAWAGCLVAAVAAVACSLRAAAVPDAAHVAAALAAYDYPHGLTDTAEAVAAGALCAAAFVAFAVGATLRSRPARGGLLLGAMLAGAVAGVLRLLCAVSPYCLAASPGLAP